MDREDDAGCPLALKPDLSSQPEISSPETATALPCQCTVLVSHPPCPYSTRLPPFTSTSSIHFSPFKWRGVWSRCPPWVLYCTNLMECPSYLTNNCASFLPIAVDPPALSTNQRCHSDDFPIPITYGRRISTWTWRFWRQWIEGPFL